MRRLVAVFGFLALLLPLFTLPATAAETSIDGRFRIVWPRNSDVPLDNAPCSPNTLCATGTLATFGAATITVNKDKFSETDDPYCLSVDRVETIHLVSGEGDLVLKGTGTVCFPGRSLDAPTDTSYGHPSMWTFDMSVRTSASTGVFAGDRGLVHESFMFAGAVGTWTLHGATE
jgi:hypothetical protein